jgi:hypothetical protein
LKNGAEKSWAADSLPGGLSKMLSVGLSGKLSASGR